MTIVQVRRLAAGLVGGVLLVAGAALVAQPRPPAPGSPRFPLPTEPRVYQTFEQKIQVTVLARGIPRPWSLLPLPDGDFLVSVRATGPDPGAPQSGTRSETAHRPPCIAH